MAENAENVQDLDKDGVTGVTPQTDQGAEAGDDSQTLQNEAVETQATSEDEQKEIPLEELEAKLSEPKPQEAEEPTKMQETAPALEQEKTETAKPNKAENRFQALANRNRELEAQIAQMKRERQQAVEREVGLKNPPWVKDPAGKGPEIEPLIVKPGEVISPEQYNQHVMAQAQKIAQAQISADHLQMENQLQAQKRQAQFDADIASIKQKYPELDQTSPNYSSELDEQVATLLSKSDVAPEKIRQAVDQIMRLRASSMAAGENQASDKIQKQVSQSALVPGRSSEDQTPNYNEIPLSEIEAKLGLVS